MGAHRAASASGKLRVTLTLSRTRPSQKIAIALKVTPTAAD